MLTLIQKARGGDAAAMAALVDKSKSQVMCLCRALLANKKTADHAVITVYKKVWEDLLAGRIGYEDDFTDFVVRKAVAHCALHGASRCSQDEIAKLLTLGKTQNIRMPKSVRSVIEINIQNVCAAIREKEKKREILLSVLCLLTEE